MHLHWAHDLPRDLSRKYKGDLLRILEIYACFETSFGGDELRSEFLWAIDPSRELSSPVLRTCGYTYFSL